MRIRTPGRRRLAAIVVLAATGLAASPPPWPLSDEGRRALDAVGADSLRGHLSFLASDALGGRVDGSPGLDVAAEYIAARFRAARLEALGDDGYFQTTSTAVATPSAEGFRFTVSVPGGQVDIPAEAFQMATVEALSVDGLELVRLPQGVTADLDAAAGRAVLTEIEAVPPGAGRGEGELERRAWMRRLIGAGPGLVILLDRGAGGATRYFDTPVMVGAPPPPARAGRIVTTSSPELARAYESLPVGRSAGRVTLRVAEPRRALAPVRNVAGVLRGSDPALAGTYLIVSAHYDGTGPRPGATGPDRVWNAANDDGSGTAAVLEIASALSGMRTRPRRSILFLAFFGEEKGLVGSTYYAAHPLVPLERTIGDLNLEHLGRTDSTERSKVGTLSLTGYDYSDLPAAVEAAGRITGIEVYKDPRRSDPFFAGSDNYALASAGVVAHTACVLFEDWPDYHGPADEWPKIDFANMERTVRTIAAATLMLADRDTAPSWTPDDPRTAVYRDAVRVPRER